VREIDVDPDDLAEPDRVHADRAVHIARGVVDVDECGRAGERRTEERANLFIRRVGA
jgi:hypothetical protein